MSLLQSRQQRTQNVNMATTEKGGRIQVTWGSHFDLGNHFLINEHVERDIFKGKR